MVKVLRVDDDVHQIITEMARADDRKIMPFVNRHFRELKEGRVDWGKVGLPGEITPSPKNTKVSVNGDKPIEIKPGGVIEYQGKTPPVIVPVPQKNTPTATPRVDDLVSADLPDAKDILQANMEQVCCKNELQPCKHWVWDAQTGEGYKNTLSGRLMEVE